MNASSSRSRKDAAISCGVLVTDGTHLLIGHATRTPRWDIPKGGPEPGEDHVQAAQRELLEETGLAAPVAALRPLGVFGYRPRKDLALFVWRVATMPDPASLRCTGLFDAGGSMLPEFDRFATPAWDEARHLLGKSLAAVLADVQAAALAVA